MRQEPYKNKRKKRRGELSSFRGDRKEKPREKRRKGQRDNKGKNRKGYKEKLRRKLKEKLENRRNSKEDLTNLVKSHLKIQISIVQVLHLVPQEVMRLTLRVSTRVILTPKEGEIIATGKGILNKNSGEYMPFTVKTGDRVIFSSYAGTEIKIEGDEFLIMTENDILGIID